MTRVRFEQITKRFGQTTALNDITIDISSGELFFLLGPSGCGKSTLLRLIAGLVEPSSGKIWFNDRDVTGLGTEKRNAVMCFQSYALWPHMNVRENVRFGLNVRGIDKQQQNARIDEVLNLVQMSHLAERKPNQMSGGQQQRVALARALVVKPDCLLLDEPLSNLDAKLRLEMRTEIRRICKEAGFTTIYVTHDQKEALSIADRMAILNGGKIEQIGAPRDVYLRPTSQFVANFIGEANFIPAKVTKVDDHSADLDTGVGLLHSTALPIGPRVSVGEQVTISLRPEAVLLGVSGKTQNAFDASVHDTIYLGEVAQHQVQVARLNSGQFNGQEFKVFELNPKFVAGDNQVERTTAWVDPKDVVVLRE